MTPEVPQLVDHLFRREAGRMVAVLTRLLGTEHLGLAEDVVQEALIKALRTWPFRGVPDNPGGWLMQVAKNRALDLLRRDINLARKEEALRGWTAALAGEGDDEALDDQLRMIFICCQPAVPRDARVALTLKIVGGFGVPEIARAYLAKEATIAQRLVRAKRKIQEIRPPFEVHAAAELPAALDSVLEAIYLIFNEGWASSTGDDLIRQDVCGEAIRLARLVAGHPALDVPKAHALAALLLLQAARNPARVDPEGNLLLLSEQNRALWNREKIAAGLYHLDQAARGTDLSAFHLEAGIAAAHAMAPSDEATDWPYILSLYEGLAGRRPQPRRGAGDGRRARGRHRRRRENPRPPRPRRLLPAPRHPGRALRPRRRRGEGGGQLPRRPGSGEPGAGAAADPGAAVAVGEGLKARI
jgi:RNA polymerase sigma factor (sigma-70 family)